MSKCPQDPFLEDEKLARPTPRKEGFHQPCAKKIASYEPFSKMSRLFLYDAAHVSGVKRDLMVADHLNPFLLYKNAVKFQFNLEWLISYQAFLAVGEKSFWN